MLPRRLPLRRQWQWRSQSSGDSSWLALRRLGGAPQGIAFGLAPKARLPLPPESGAAYARFVADRTAYSGESAAYLCMRPGEQAPFGAEAPLAGLVVLDRGAAGAGLEPLSAAASVRALVPHCYAAGRPALALVRDRKMAFLLARQNDMAPVNVH